MTPVTDRADGRRRYRPRAALRLEWHPQTPAFRHGKAAVRLGRPWPCRETRCGAVLLPSRIAAHRCGRAGDRDPSERAKPAIRKLSAGLLLSSNAIVPNPPADAIAPSRKAAAALELAATSLACGRNLAVPVFDLILKLEEYA
jgi:hypothetical protein